LASYDLEQSRLPLWAADIHIKRLQNSQKIWHK
jgi:hypothetical protein